MGNIEIGETVKIATFSQDDSHMDLSMKAIDYVKEGESGFQQKMELK